MKYVTLLASYFASRFIFLMRESQHQDVGMSTLPLHFCCLLDTCMWKCRDEHFVFRTAGLSQYTFIAGNSASCFAILVLPDAHPNLGKISPRITNQGYHIRASVGGNEFLLGNLGPLRHFHQGRCRNVRFQCRFEVILLRQAGASAVLGPLVYPKIIVLG